jgi:hypothetical protein
MGLQKLLKGLTNQRQDDQRAEQYRNLIRHEAKIGGQLFGPVPAGGKREFFCLDKYTWVWHEEWVEDGQPKVRNIRYDFRPEGVLKSQNGHFQPITREEARHLHDAIKLYGEKIDQELYSRIRATRAR